MGAKEEKHAAAEALYKAIRAEVEKVGELTNRDREPAFVLETLAHAYSMVAESHVVDPDAPKGRAVSV